MLYCLVSIRPVSWQYTQNNKAWGLAINYGEGDYKTGGGGGKLKCYPHVRRKRSLLGQMYCQSKHQMNLVENRCERIVCSAEKSSLKYQF